MLREFTYSEIYFLVSIGTFLCVLTLLYNLMAWKEGYDWRL